jgi:hypothetical protein
MRVPFFIDVSSVDYLEGDNPPILFRYCLVDLSEVSYPNQLNTVVLAHTLAYEVIGFLHIIFIIRHKGSRQLVVSN